ncbi:hypothetical protein PIB30_023687 [Stylosanthes scabra]|uniref:Uncharacterized protein n=1 Tax=Stylosanthes scabra TaxID=79078 RepID=A0ABU6T9U9_9FABA|nr:hypothetical protein [Stylosanthes scabra]
MALSKWEGTRPAAIINEIRGLTKCKQAFRLEFVLNQPDQALETEVAVKDLDLDLARHLVAVMAFAIVDDTDGTEDDELPGIPATVQKGCTTEATPHEEDGVRDSTVGR